MSCKHKLMSCFCALSSVNSVGLKMNLLDVNLAIDLQYLGVSLPIPPPGVSLLPPSQELPLAHGESFTLTVGGRQRGDENTSFMSRFLPEKLLKGSNLILSLHFFLQTKPANFSQKS